MDKISLIMEPIIFLLFARMIYKGNKEKIILHSISLFFKNVFSYSSHYESNSFIKG